MVELVDKRDLVTLINSILNLFFMRLDTFPLNLKILNSLLVELERYFRERNYM